MPHRLAPGGDAFWFWGACCCNNVREKVEPDDPIILSIANGVLADINQYLRWNALSSYTSI